MDDGQITVTIEYKKKGIKKPYIASLSVKEDVLSDMENMYQDVDVLTKMFQTLKLEILDNVRKKNK